MACREKGCSMNPCPKCGHVFRVDLKGEYGCPRCNHEECWPLDYRGSLAAPRPRYPEKIATPRPWIEWGPWAQEAELMKRLNRRRKHIRGNMSHKTNSIELDNNKSATGCFNCKFNVGEHPEYEIGRKYKFWCNVKEGHHGNSQMVIEDPAKPLCQHWKLQHNPPLNRPPESSR
jgi:hypothetical protein